jgi:hypothetical protein
MKKLLGDVLYEHYDKLLSRKEFDKSAGERIWTAAVLPGGWPRTADSRFFLFFPARYARSVERLAHFFDKDRINRINGEIGNGACPPRVDTGFTWQEQSVCTGAGM